MLYFQRFSTFFLMMTKFGLTLFLSFSMKGGIEEGCWKSSLRNWGRKSLQTSENQIVNAFSTDLLQLTVICNQCGKNCSYLYFSWESLNLTEKNIFQLTRYSIVISKIFSLFLEASPPCIDSSPPPSTLPFPCVCFAYDSLPGYFGLHYGSIFW